MQTLFFWKEWAKSYRILWFIFVALFLLSIGMMWFYADRDARNIINWEKIQEQKVVDATVHTFRLGAFGLNVPAESYVIFEYLQGSSLHHNTVASGIFLIVFIFSALVLLTVFSTLERFWYFAAMGLFIIFVVSLRLDALAVFGLTNYTIPAVVLAGFVGVSYYFKSFRPATSFGYRLLTFSILATATAILIYFFAESAEVMLHVVTASYTSAVVISLLFVLMVSHEIVASFVYISSQGGSKSLRHFTIISLIYLLNVLIAALNITGFIKWDFIYVNAFLLLTVSAILGLWGFRNRETLYSNIFSFSPVGAFFFIGLGTICFITLVQLFGNANDAPIKVINDIIIFAHFGFGLIFITYVISNFFAMMAENAPAHKILYRPNRMPYFTFRLAGLIVTLVFIFYMNWRDYVYHSLAGFYNYVGDLYMIQDNETFGRSFYESSRSYAFQNHRANYALATIKSERLDFEEAMKNYDLANGKRPSEFSVVNKGDLYLWRQMYFPAIDEFQNALKVKSTPALNNNLGFAYAKIHSIDSALHFLGEARDSELTENSAEANFFAFVATEFLPVKTDSVLEIFDTKSPTVLANATAAATLFRQEVKLDIDPLASESLDLHSATLLNNYIIKNVKTLDTAFISKAYRIANLPDNVIFSEALKASLAYAYYHKSNLYRAIELLSGLSYTTQDYRGKYNYVMGLWVLEQGSPTLAMDFFTYAVESDHKDARLYNAIALTELGRVDEALAAWDTVAAAGNSGATEMATRIKRILTISAANAQRLTDPEKYQYCRYRLSVRDTTEFNRIVNTFEYPDYKAQSILDMARKQFRADRIVPAIKLLNRLSNLELTDKKLYEEIQHFELLMLASRNEAYNLAEQINKGVTFEDMRYLEKTLYKAIIDEANNDLSEAERNYEIVGTMNPFFEDGILAAVRFYRKKDPKSHKAYNLIAEAIQINSTSLRLLKEYAGEAARIGFDDYAASAWQRVEQIEAGL